MEHLPYRALLRHAVLELGLSPEAFWQMTCKEWHLLVEEQIAAPRKQEVMLLAKQWQEHNESLSRVREMVG